jgi:3-isopropylmalate/(R)-2-methylmalate dehydratase large subunit
LSAGTLYDKVWDLHRVAELPGGSTQLFIGLHLIHEVTTPQAFAGLRDLGLGVRHPERTVATVDHIVPTTSQARPSPIPWPRRCWRPWSAIAPTTASPSMASAVAARGSCM